MNDEQALRRRQHAAGLGKPGCQLFVRPVHWRFQQLTAGLGHFRQEGSVQQRTLAHARAAMQDHSAMGMNQLVECRGLGAAVAEELRGQRWGQKGARADERVAPIPPCWRRLLRLWRTDNDHVYLTTAISTQRRSVYPIDIMENSLRSRKDARTQNFPPLTSWRLGVRDPGSRRQSLLCRTIAY